MLALALALLVTLPPSAPHGMPAVSPVRSASTLTKEAMASPRTPRSICSALSRSCPPPAKPQQSSLNCRVSGSQCRRDCTRDPLRCLGKSPHHRHMAGGTQTRCYRSTAGGERRSAPRARGLIKARARRIAGGSPRVKRLAEDPKTRRCTCCIAWPVTSSTVTCSRRYCQICTKTLW